MYRLHAGTTLIEWICLVKCYFDTQQAQMLAVRAAAASESMNFGDIDSWARQGVGRHDVLWFNPPRDSGTPNPWTLSLHSVRPSVTVTDEPRSITALPQILGSRLVPSTTSPIQVGDISNHLTPSHSPSSIVPPSKPALPHSNPVSGSGSTHFSPSHHTARQHVEPVQRGRRRQAQGREQRHVDHRRQWRVRHHK